MAGLHSGAGAGHHIEHPSRSVGVHANLAAAGSRLDLKQHWRCVYHEVTGNESADVRNPLRGSVYLMTW